MKFLNFIKYFLYIEITLMSILTGHHDVVGNVFWGVNLLDVTFKGDFFNYQNILFDNHFPTNYTLLSNIFVAIILSPIYLMGVGDANMPYIIFYKFILAIITILASKTIGDIVRGLKFSERNANLSEILFLNSLYIQPISFFFGQLDFVGNFLLILGVKYLVKNNLKLCLLLFAFSYCIKPFPVVIIVPMLCLIFPTIKKNLIKNSLI